MENVKIDSVNFLNYNQVKLGPNSMVLVVRNGNSANGHFDTISSCFYAAPKVNYTVVKEYPHNMQYFTEGLLIDKDKLFESTGLEGRSKIIEYKLDNNLAEVATIKNVDSIFGEGIVVYKNLIYQLTWKNHIVYQYDKNSLKRKNEFRYSNDGWGITFDGTSLLASDGSAYLYTINPENFKILKKFQVIGEDGPVLNINELEYVNGIIVANIWQTDRIVYISARTGYVIGFSDFSELSFKNKEVNQEDQVLNGIAYDPSDSTFMITGKLWRKIYKIKLDKTYDSLIEQN